jgi:hypothetical protein
MLRRGTPRDQRTHRARRCRYAAKRRRGTRGTSLCSGLDQRHLRSDRTAKKMNEDEKQKVDTKGK